ncbi:MAG: hypothetical protein C0475_06510 [Planctomyces sp.]|nr:hypothetical protein [Planctomyces sp.]MBA4120079.1 hypothetical protein [Isosphaera sp.]
MAHQTLPHAQQPPDTWHTHGPAEAPRTAHGESIRVGQALFLGLAGFAIIAFFVTATIVYFYHEASKLRAAREEFREKAATVAGLKPPPGVQDPALAERREALQGRLVDESYTAVFFDSDTPRVRLPIQRAIERVVTTYSDRAPAD